MIRAALSRYIRAGRGAQVVIVLAAAIVVAAIVGVFGVASTAIHNRVVFGEFYSAGAPPRVDYCGRRYYPGDRTETLAKVQEFLALNEMKGLTRIDSTPSGMPIVTNVMSPGQKAYFQTDVCTMMLWVQTGPDAYVAYSLSGGP